MPTARHLLIMPNNFGVDMMKNETLWRSSGDACTSKLETRHSGQARNSCASSAQARNHTKRAFQRRYDVYSRANSDPARLSGVQLTLIYRKAQYRRRKDVVWNPVLGNQFVVRSDNVNPSLVQNDGLVRAPSPIEVFFSLIRGKYKGK